MLSLTPLLPHLGGFENSALNTELLGSIPATSQGVFNERSEGAGLQRGVLGLRVSGFCLFVDFWLGESFLSLFARPPPPPPAPET